MKYPKISVVVPIYNVESYLEKSLDSILNQDYPNLEIILIDDCSKDSSYSIAKKYQKKDKRIVLLQNPKNRGLSFTRNRGIEVATGDYIGFIDSDDTIPTNYYSSLYRTISKNKADIAICDINIVYENGNTVRQTCGSLSNDKMSFIDCGLAASACNKLFRKELLSKDAFEVGKTNEDLAVVLPLVIRCRKACYNKEVCYNYLQRQSSIQNNAFSDKRFDIFGGVDLTLERIRGVKDEELYQAAIVYNQLIVLLLYVVPKVENFKERYPFLRKYHQLSKKYHLTKNPFLKKFLADNRKLYRLYYGGLVYLNSYGLIFLDNLLISSYLCYHNRRVGLVQRNITKDDLIKAAERQAKRSVVDKKVSVVVPNYNYSNYLYQRIYSILYQTYKIDEIIILDDCSKDNSREVIDDLVEVLSPYVNIRKLYNETNSGRAFTQWEKGMNAAKNPYVWIAEADDYASRHFLKHVMKPYDDDEVIISYCDTKFMDADGNQILKSIVPEIDIQKTGHWDESYINDGKDEFHHYTFLNCTIANVSSAVIRKGDYSKEFALAKQYKQAGDWMFYANLMQKGKVAYFARGYNYYRVHTNNVSTVTKKQDHIEEIKRIHAYYDQEFHLDAKQKKEIQKRYQFLAKVWRVKV